MNIEVQSGTSSFFFLNTFAVIYVFSINYLRLSVNDEISVTKDLSSSDFSKVILGLSLSQQTEKKSFPKII